MAQWMRFKTCGASSRTVRPLLAAFFTGLGAGGTAALLFDPRMGRRRRALARGKLGRYGRQVARGVVRSARGVAGPAQGFCHTAEKRLPGYEPAVMPDTHEFVKHRVETALGREPGLPMSAVNVDAADGIVNIRGTVPDAETARRMVDQAAAVEGVRAVISLMHLPDGTPIEVTAGDLIALNGPPIAITHGEAVLNRLLQRWPNLTDADILASSGHVGTLTRYICRRTGEPEERVRADLDYLLIPAM